MTILSEFRLIVDKWFSGRFENTSKKTIFEILEFKERQEES